MARRDEAATRDERARLQAAAFGPGANPEDAAAARRRLAAIDRVALVESPVAPAVTPRSDPVPTARRATATPATAATTEPGATRTPDLTTAPDPTTAPEAATPPVAPPPPDAPPTLDATPPPEATASAPEPAGPTRDRPSGGLIDIGRALMGANRLRVLSGAAVVVVIAGAAFLGGRAVGMRPSAPEASSPETSAAAAPGSNRFGTLTVSQLLSAPQTYADRLPEGIVAPVRAHTARLVFTNRSLQLEADDSVTPWAVYAAVGNDPSGICLVATSDGHSATEACYAKESFTRGTVSLVARAPAETLTVTVTDGVLSAMVTPG